MTSSENKNSNAFYQKVTIHYDDEDEEYVARRRATNYYYQGRGTSVSEALEDLAHVMTNMQERQDSIIRPGE